jgi:hypothetical protein
MNDQKTTRYQEASAYTRRIEGPERERRHWSAQSQPFATGDVLLQLLDEGWRVYRRVFVEDYACTSHRRVQVYHFVLMRGADRLKLSVLSNPAMRRLVCQYELVYIERRT